MVTNNLVLLILACHGGELHIDELDRIGKEAIAEHGSIEAATRHFQKLYNEMGRPMPSHLKH